MSRKRNALAGLALLAGMMPVMAMDPGHSDDLVASPTLTLAEVLGHTLQHNPDIQTLQALDGEVRARKIHAEGLLPGAPILALRHQNDVVGDGRGEREWEIGVELPFWLPGQKSARQRVAMDAENGLAASREALHLQFSGMLRDAIWDVVTNRDALQMADYRVNVAEGLQRDVERRRDAGEISTMDAMLAQNEVLQARAEHIRAQAELKHAQHRYRMLTGLGQIPAQPAETLAANPDMAQHPLLREAESRVAQMHSARELVGLEQRENSQLTLNARTQRGAFDQAYNDSVGIGLRIPLASAVRHAPLRAGAESAYTQAVVARDRLRMTLETMLHEAEHNLEVAQQELGIATQKQGIARENLRLAEKAFRLGETDLVQLMRVQALAYEAERALSRSRIRVHWDTARYNQVIGVSL